MPAQVTIQPSGHRFETNDDETLLAAALRNGFMLPYGCRNGACGSCKGKVLSGTVELGAHQVNVLSTPERAAGWTLFCCAHPHGEVVIECREINALKDIPVKTMPCRVQRIERPAPDVAVLYLKLPANERLQFLAGQYIDLLLKSGRRRSYSMANPPHSEEFLQLHVRHMAGGHFTEHVFKTMKEREILRMEGPLGSFFLREDGDKPIVLLASGTGFAPIKAIIEHALHKAFERPMTLYWGGRRPRDLYMHELAVRWQAAHGQFKFIPVVSDALPEDHWDGRKGFVHQAVMADLPDLSGHQVYACGAPVMVDAARNDFITHCALPAEEFYSDAFTPAVDPGT